MHPPYVSFKAQHTANANSGLNQSYSFNFPYQRYHLSVPLLIAGCRHGHSSPLAMDYAYKYISG